jgi:hypothetical protein
MMGWVMDIKRVRNMCMFSVNRVSQLVYNNHENRYIPTNANNQIWAEVFGYPSGFNSIRTENRNHDRAVYRSTPN